MSATRGTQPWAIIASSNLSEHGRKGSVVEAGLLLSAGQQEKPSLLDYMLLSPEYKPQFPISNVVFFSFWAKVGDIKLLLLI